MLLDPFEEQFDLPAPAVELRDGQCWQAEVVGQENQRLAGLRVAIADAADGFWIAALIIETVQDHCLVEAQPGAFVHGTRVTSAAAEVLSSAGEKESQMTVDSMQASKIQIRSIHNIEGTRLVNQMVQKIDVVDAARGDNHHRGNVALQVEQGM